MLEIPREAAHTVGLINPVSGWRVFKFRSADVRKGGMTIAQYNRWRTEGGTRTIADATVGLTDAEYPVPDGSVPVVNLNDASSTPVEEGIPLWFIKWPSDYVPRTIEIPGDTLFQGFDFRLHGEWLAFFQDPEILFPNMHVVCSSGADLSSNALCHVLGIDRRPGAVLEISKYHWQTFSTSQFVRAAAQACGYDVAPAGRVRAVSNLTNMQACLVSDTAMLARAGVTVGESCVDGTVPGRALQLMVDAYLPDFVSFPGDDTYSMIDRGTPSDFRYFPIGLFLGGKYKDTFLYTLGMTAVVVSVNDVMQSRIELRVWNGSAFVVDAGLSDAYVQETGVLFAAQNTSLWEVLTGDTLGANFPDDVVGPANILTLLVNAGLTRRMIWLHMPDVAEPGDPAKIKLNQFIEHQRPSGVVCIISNSLP
jgi:hypothetical protein